MSPLSRFEFEQSLQKAPNPGSLIAAYLPYAPPVLAGALEIPDCVPIGSWVVTYESGDLFLHGDKQGRHLWRPDASLVPIPAVGPDRGDETGPVGRYFISFPIALVMVPGTNSSCTSSARRGNHSASSAVPKLFP